MRASGEPSHAAAGWSSFACLALVTYPEAAGAEAAQRQKAARCSAAPGHLGAIVAHRVGGVWGRRLGSGPAPWCKTLCGVHDGVGGVGVSLGMRDAQGRTNMQQQPRLCHAMRAHAATQRRCGRQDSVCCGHGPGRMGQQLSVCGGAVLGANPQRHTARPATTSKSVMRGGAPVAFLRGRGDMRTARPRAVLD